MTTRERILSIIEPALGGAVVAYVSTMLISFGLALVAGGVALAATLSVGALRALMAGLGSFAVVAIVGAAIAPSRAISVGLGRALATRPFGADVAAWLVERLGDGTVGELRLRKTFADALAVDGPGVRGRLADRFRRRLLEVVERLAQDHLQGAAGRDPSVTELAAHVGTRLDDALRDHVAAPARRAELVGALLSIAAIVAIVAAAHTL